MTCLKQQSCFQPQMAQDKTTFTALPSLVVGNLPCLVLFTNNPVRREFRCPLYRVSSIQQFKYSFLYDWSSLHM